MRILVTNDDGVHAPGIRALARALETVGDVTVVAPADQQSAIGHSITIFHPLTIEKLQNGKRTPVFSVSGTPADCVKLAVREILKRTPDLVVSGINHGGNLGINVVYSGTVAGAVEASILGIPSMAVSLNTHGEARFEGYARLVARWLKRHAAELLREVVAYNVNIPFLPPSRIKGILFTRQHPQPYADVFHRRVDPRGRTYFWLGADPVQASKTNGHVDDAADVLSDLEAVKQGYVSVTPLAVDRTHYSALVKLRGQNGGGSKRRVRP